jgi:hypothetical protein
LEVQEPDRWLFLAVTEVAYRKHFQKSLFQMAVRRNKINMLVYDPTAEVIVQWLPQTDMPSF